MQVDTIEQLQVALAENPQLEERVRHLRRAIVNPLYWAQNATHTQDDQDPQNPYKPFPRRKYFDVCLQLWLNESVVVVEKSRTMLMTWLFSAFCLHWVMSNQPGCCIFLAQDEKRSLKPLDYCWTLWEQSEPELKELWALDRPRKQQSYSRMEFAKGGTLLALPGKEPDAIRSEHPSIVFIDEAAFVERGGECLDVCLATRVPKLVCVSSAYPGWFRNWTKEAKVATWPNVP